MSQAQSNPIDVAVLGGRAKTRARAAWRLVKRVCPIARERVRAFRETKSIGPKTRQDLLRRLIRSEAQVALLQANEARVNLFFQWSFMVATMILFILTPFAVIKFFGASYGFFASVGIFYGSLIGWSAILVVIAGPFYSFRLSSTGGTALSSFWLFWFVFGLFTCGFALYFILLHSHLSQGPWYLILAASSISQTIVYVAGAILASTCGWVAKTAVAARRVTHAADAMFVDKMLRALQIVGLTDRSWLNLNSKNALMRELEGAARIASEGLPRALRTGDPYTDAWLRNRCNEIAASSRAKKTWICMPKSDTRQRLEERLVQCFINAVSGNWDGLETTEPRQLSRQDIKVRIRTFLLGLFEALLPAAAYRGAQVLGFLTPGLLNDYLGFGVVLWAVIATLLALDPRFGEKVEAVQKVASMIPGLSKKKDD
jgi:hypothetical protein